jgi:hypothetical protein
MNIKKLLASAVIFGIMFFSEKHANALILNTKILKNFTNDKVILLLGDGHNVGSIEDNLLQRDLFIKKIKELNRDYSSEIQILFEGATSYSPLHLNTSVIKRKFNNEGKPVNSFKIDQAELNVAKPVSNEKSMHYSLAYSFSTQKRSETTWMDFDLVEGYNQLSEAEMKSISLRSIDPRGVFVSPFQVVEHMSSQFDIFQDVESALSLQELVNMERRIQKEHIGKDLNTTLNAMRKSNYLLTDKEVIANLIKLKDVTSLNRYQFFYQLLDQLAILHLAKDNAPKLSVLVAGAVHTENVSTMLQSGLEYVLIGEFGYSIKLLSENINNISTESVSDSFEQVFSIQELVRKWSERVLDKHTSDDVRQ